MKFKANNIRLQYTEEGNVEIVLSTNLKHLDISKEKEIIANDKELSVAVKQYRQKRSLDANSYCWVLCQKLAEVLRSTKEEIYQKAIREVGQFEILVVRKQAVKEFIRMWNNRGLGWFAETMPGCKIDSCERIMVYFGSSVYDTRAMAILIDYLISECKELDIETLPDEELASLVREYEMRESGAA